MDNFVADSGSSKHLSSANHSTDSSTQRSSKDSRAAAIIRHNQRHDSDSDQDIPRRRTEQRRSDSDPDLSPLRAGHLLSASSAVRARDQRHDSSSDSDLSPVRAGGAASRRINADSDQSPKRAGKRSTQRHDSDSDLSPPRARDQAAFRTAQNVSHHHDSDSDLSPPRTKNFRDAESNISPVHRDQNSSHSSRQPAHHRHSSHTEDTKQLKRTACMQDSDGNLSPKRRRPNSNPVADTKRHRNDSDLDLSPPRADKPQKATVHNKDRQITTEKATKTLSGAQAGLQLAADMRKESQELRRRENASFAKACFMFNTLHLTNKQSTLGLWATIKQKLKYVNLISTVHFKIFQFCPVVFLLLLEFCISKCSLIGQYDWHWSVKA